MNNVHVNISINEDGFQKYYIISKTFVWFCTKILRKKNVLFLDIVNKHT